MEKVKETQQQLKEQLNLNESDADAVIRRQLVLNIDSIRKEKMSFKKSCREEKAALDHKLSQLQQEKAAEQIDDPETIHQQEEQLKAILLRQQQKLDKLMSLYVELCNDVTRHQRRLDEIPSRAEITQYQRRFVELFDQIASRHVEAKMLYVLYNQLDDMRVQMEKDFNLLNSVMDSFSL